jgi:hypothetical protein
MNRCPAFVVAALRWACLMGYGEGHGEPADVPDEPAQFAGDSDHRNVLLLAARDEFSEAPDRRTWTSQARSTMGLGMPSWRRWMPGLTRAGC